MKRLISLMLALTLTASLLTVGAFAAQPQILTMTAAREGDRLTLTVNAHDVSFNAFQVLVEYDTERLAPLNKDNDNVAGSAGDMITYIQPTYSAVFNPTGWMTVVRTELNASAGTVEVLLQAAQERTGNDPVDAQGFADTGSGMDLFSLSFQVKEGATLYSDSIRLGRSDSVPEGIVVAAKGENGAVSGVTTASAAEIDLSAVAEPGKTPGGIDNTGSGGEGGGDGEDGVLPEPIPTEGTTLTDIDGHWARSNILALVERGVLTGYADGTFRPKNSLTRAEFAIVLAKAFDLPLGEGPSFADCTGWAAPYVAAAAQAGYMNGVGGSSFAPNRAITREEVVTVVARAMGLTSDKQPDFPDADEISAWAREGVAASVEAGLVSGRSDGTFGPKLDITRGEMAKLVDLMLQNA